MKNQNGIATLTPTRIEVGCTRRGRPSYRWTTGYYITSPAGTTIHPPMRLYDARRFCRAEGWTPVVKKG